MDCICINSFSKIRSDCAGTIRSDFAETIDANAVHGSDSPESAAREIAYFFDDSEIVG